MKTAQVLAVVTALMVPGMALANSAAAEGTTGGAPVTQAQERNLDVRTLVRAWSPLVGAVGMTGLGVVGVLGGLGVAAALGVWQVGQLARVEDPVTASFPATFTRGPLQLAVLGFAGALTLAGVTLAGLGGWAAWLGVGYGTETQTAAP